MCNQWPSFFSLLGMEGGKSKRDMVLEVVEQVRFYFALYVILREPEQYEKLAEELVKDVMDEPD
jgi:hypothetical protein